MAKEKKKKDGTISKQGEGGGRPPKFKTDEKLNIKCKAYFKECISLKEIPSKAGLRVYLDISRETYSEYKDKFVDAIKRAEDLIEKAWVQRLRDAAATGAIFYLKNAFKEDYKDRTETDLTSKGEKITNINYIIPNEPKRKGNNS